MRRGGVAAAAAAAAAGAAGAWWVWSGGGAGAGGGAGVTGGRGSRGVGDGEWRRARVVARRRATPPTTAASAAATAATQGEASQAAKTAAVLLSLRLEGESSAAQASALQARRVPDAVRVRMPEESEDEMNWGNEYTVLRPPTTAATAATAAAPGADAQSEAALSSLELLVKGTGRRGVADALMALPVGGRVELAPSGHHDKLEAQGLGFNARTDLPRLAAAKRRRTSASEAPLVAMVAGGTGVAPMVAILEDIVRAQGTDQGSASPTPTPDAAAAAARFVVAVSARTAADVMLHERLEALVATADEGGPTPPCSIVVVYLLSHLDPDDTEAHAAAAALLGVPPERVLPGVSIVGSDARGGPAALQRALQAANQQPSDETPDMVLLCGPIVMLQAFRHAWKKDVYRIL